MGSGRGVSRRTRAVAAQEVVVSVAAWKNFWETAGIGDLDFLEYYGGELLPGTKAEYVQQTSDYANALNEFLADAIAVGALKLPQGCAANDLSISLKRRFDNEGLPSLPNFFSNVPPFFDVTLKNKRTGKQHVEDVGMMHFQSIKHTSNLLTRGLQRWINATL